MWCCPLGGATGANAHYWIGSWFKAQVWAGTFPLGTFVINVSGSLILALASVLLLEQLTPARQELFLLIGTGFCGAYTTFSTFEMETYQLLRNNEWELALLNVVGSVLAGFLAVLFGVKLLKG